MHECKCSSSYLCNYLICICVDNQKITDFWEAGCNLYSEISLVRKHDYNHFVNVYSIALTHSQAHKDIIIHSQSSTSVSSVMTKPSPNVDGPSFIKSQFASLHNILNLIYYYGRLLVLENTLSLVHVYHMPQPYAFPLKILERKCMEKMTHALTLEMIFID